MIRPLLGADIDVAARIHNQSFEAGWDKDSLSGYIAPDVIALGYFENAGLIGFIVLGPVKNGATHQTDIITIAVDPKRRGKSVGRQLLDAAEQQAQSRGVEIMFLEVAEDNIAALALYRRAGYSAIGRRKNYYKRKGGRVSALTFKKQLC